MFSMKKISVLTVGTLLAVNVAYANFGDAVVGGLVGGAVGSVITNEVYNNNRAHSHSSAQHHYHRSTKRKRHTAAPQDTPQKKIQRALASLGFYRGRIDGEINSFETRSAIKEMNMAYERGNSASLTPEVKDALIFLGTLF
jgi:uncharacterized membrane protein